MLLRFVASESAFSYFAATRSDLEAHGRPVAFYSDKQGILRVNSKTATDEAITQFGIGLCELNIDIIYADSPQAKGWFERRRARRRAGLDKGAPGGLPVNQRRIAAGRARPPNKLEAPGAPPCNGRSTGPDDISTLHPQ